MDKRKDRWANGWSHAEDALLLEAMEISNSKDRKAWELLCKLGVHRTYKAFANRRRLLELKQREDIKAQLPKGWGIYV